MLGFVGCVTHKHEGLLEINVCGASLLSNSYSHSQSSHNCFALILMNFILFTQLLPEFIISTSVVEHGYWTSKKEVYI